MENRTRPTPPNKSEGCFNCGRGKQAELSSKTVGGVSVALCHECDGMPVAKLATQPHNARIAQAERA